MYTLIILLGLSCVITAVFMLKKENDVRNNQVRQAFNNSSVGVYDGCDLQRSRLVNLYPVRSVKHTCGRKPKLSRHRVDFEAPTNDNSLSRDAAIFSVENGKFYIKRRKQKTIWIRDNDRNVYLLKADDDTKMHTLPGCFISLGNRDMNYTVVPGDGMELHFGYKILMGATLFEFNDWGVLHDKFE